VDILQERFGSGIRLKVFRPTHFLEEGQRAKFLMRLLRPTENGRGQKSKLSFIH